MIIHKLTLTEARSFRKRAGLDYMPLAIRSTPPVTIKAYVPTGATTRVVHSQPFHGLGRRHFGSI